LGGDPLVYERLGRHAEALSALEKLRSASASDPSLRIGAGIALAGLGQRPEAERILAEQKEAAKKVRALHRVLLAQLCFAVGDKGQGFAYLDQAYETRDPALAFMRMFPGFDVVRDEPRLPALVKKIGIPGGIGK
jgi:predicted Zn-dependent protease